AGISPKAGKYGCKAKCFVAAKRTRALAEKEGITRARAACRLNKVEFQGSIVVIGNSPTALLELAELVKNGLKPALVIAAPVGFVKAKESKEEILKLRVPCIAVTGVKGGTPVAVAIVNALIKLAEKNEQET
ncbi:MAG: precorrin-8X methylmutase, partial [Candidatus Hydrothermarchaeota archaeon]|nr:precorrin-8X methylmutase [Candidatus Hydrothermarchaeota archaeon]